MNVQFKLDINDKATPFPHYWEKCVGSCHAYMGLREDWRKQLKKCREDLGFQYVRFHGLLNDDMSVYVNKASNGTDNVQTKYSFFNIDSVFDYLLKIGMKPFIELGFMPEGLASGKETCFHYKGNITPPYDYNEWENLIRLLVQHLVNRYGLNEVRTWYFEVWNEPNLSYFWSGTRDEYFKLYMHSALAIKSVDCELRVGGPATSVNAWIPEFIQFCKDTNTAVDFISTHHYPTDDPLWKNNKLTMEEFFKDFGKYERGILFKMTAKAKTEAGKLPLFYTEWNTSAMLPDSIHDECYSSAMVAKTIADNDGLVEGYSYWTFTDLFEESGQFSVPFHGGFGLQTIYGIPKPTYRLFEMMHRMGNKRLKVEGNITTTVEILATSDEKDIYLLVYNHNVLGEPIDEQEVCVRIDGIECIKKALITRIDESSANPKMKWIELGAPEYPNDEELEQMYEASLPISFNIIPEHNNGGSIINFKVPPFGVAMVKLEI